VDDVVVTFDVTVEAAYSVTVTTDVCDSVSVVDVSGMTVTPRLCPHWLSDCPYRPTLARVTTASTSVNILPYSTKFARSRC
jgi:hypothetical protein